LTRPPFPFVTARPSRVDSFTMGLIIVRMLARQTKPRGPTLGSALRGGRIVTIRPASGERRFPLRSFPPIPHRPSAFRAGHCRFELGLNIAARRTRILPLMRPSGVPVRCFLLKSNRRSGQNLTTNPRLGFRSASRIVCDSILDLSPAPIAEPPLGFNHLV